MISQFLKSHAQLQFSGITSLLSTVSESLKTLALEEAPYPDRAATSDASLSSPVYNRREVRLGSFTFCKTERLLFTVIFPFEMVHI